MDLVQIGVIHSMYGSHEEAPRQGRLVDDVSTIEIYPEYADCLKDIETVSHLIVLYWAHKADRSIHQSSTPFGEEIHGVFATRSPNRPNPVSLGIADLVQRRGNTLTVRRLDALDGSPVIDIKPYSSAIDSIPDAVIGWR